MRLNLLERKENAHKDSIWAAKWVTEPGAQGEDVKLITGSVDESCKAWSYNRSRGLSDVRTFNNFDLGVVSVDVNPTGEVMASSTLDCCVRVVDIRKEDQLFTLSLQGPECWSLAFHPSPEVSQLAVAAGCLGGVSLYKTDEGLEETARPICHLEARSSSQSLKTSQPPFALGCAYDPSGTMVACSHSDGHIVLYDVETQKHLLTFAGHSKPVRDLCFTSDGKFLISACDDKTCNLYDIKSKLPIGSLNGHEASVLCVEQGGLSEGYCATGSHDGGIKVWDLRNRSCTQTLNDQKVAVWSLAVHDEAGCLASVSDDAAVCVYSVLKQ